MLFKVKALYDYVSGHEDDLNFSVGQIITVTDEEDADWYGGEYIDESGVKHEGIFPKNFVEKYEPTAPPRPTRSRPKREPEPAPAPVPPPDSPEQAAPAPEPQPEPVAPASPPQTAPAPPPAPASVPEPPAPKPAQPAQPPQVPAPAPAPAPAPPVPQPAEVPSASSPPAPKPGPSPPKSSGGPPPVAEKPVSSSFKDRIAAFNKAAAPPIAPFKPGGLSSNSAGFIKKPFVAPPPSRNAYIPPPTQVPIAKIYRREEDPEVKEQEAEAAENAGKAGLVPAAASNEGEAEEEQPKPMSLKERLALLQKQQMEAAARRAEAAARKEKPKRPPKKRVDSQEAAEGEPSERRDTADETARTSTDEGHPPRAPHPGRRRSSKGVEPRDGNEADMSGAGDTTEDQEDLTEREDSDGRARQAAASSRQDDGDQDQDEDDEEDEEDDIDPEIRRREELRARMARMAGGMGMPGMGMPLFGAPLPVLPKKKKSAPEKRPEEAAEPVSPTARAPPVPLPGMMRPPPPPEPKEPEPEREEAEEEEEEESRQKTPLQESAPPCMFIRDATGPHMADQGDSPIERAQQPSSHPGWTTDSAPCPCGL